MFVGKARSTPKSGALERCFSRVDSSLSHKHQTKVKRLAGDKHSSLLQTFVNYSFYKGLFTLKSDFALSRLVYKKKIFLYSKMR
jgi:hypothetical protein